MTSAPPDDEVDLGRFGRALAQRWWLPVAGLVAGVILGWLTTLGGTQTYRAQAVVYLGQPLGILGGSTVPSLNTNPTAARAIVSSETTVRRVSTRSGMTPPQLRRGTSVTAIAGVTSTKQSNVTPLVTVTVKGPQAAKVRDAANLFANQLVNQMSGYATTKIDTLTQEQNADEKAIAAISSGLTSRSLSVGDKLILQLQLTQRQSDLTQAKQLLSLARNVEAPRVVTHATATKTSARSHRNSAAVGGLIGLIVGVLVALLWDPFARARRSTG